MIELPEVLFRNTAPHTVLEPVYKESVPIVLSANDRFSPYLDSMIRSVIFNASEKRNYDIIILYNDISERNQRIIQSAANEKKNISIRFVRVCEYFDARKLFVDQHLSVETYYRLIIPEIMPNYHKILYPVSYTHLVETLKLDSPYDYFQAGVLILDLDGFRKMTSSQKMIQLALSHSFRCHDQDVLNIVCKNKVTYIPQQWNTLMDWQEPEASRMQILKMAPRKLFEEYSIARKKPYLIHYAGYQKPWDVVDCDFAEYFWMYAKKSPYYPILLRRIRRCFDDEKNATVASNEQAISDEQVVSDESVIHYIPKRSGIWRIVDIILPYHSNRREWITKIYWNLKK